MLEKDEGIWIMQNSENIVADESKYTVLGKYLCIFKCSVVLVTVVLVLEGSCFVSSYIEAATSRFLTPFRGI